MPDTVQILCAGIILILLLLLFGWVWMRRWIDHTVPCTLVFLLGLYSLLISSLVVPNFSGGITVTSDMPTNEVEQKTVNPNDVNQGSMVVPQQTPAVVGNSASHSTAVESRDRVVHPRSGSVSLLSNTAFKFTLNYSNQMSNVQLIIAIIPSTLLIFGCLVLAKTGKGKSTRF